MDNFADVLKDLIAEKGLKLREIERESGSIKNNTLSTYLNGAYPTPDKAIKLARYFDCTLDYLFGLSEDRTKKPKENLCYNKDKFLKMYYKILAENNTTNYTFAKENQFSEACWRKWRKTSVPNMRHMLIIAKGLSCSLDWLLSE